MSKKLMISIIIISIFLLTITITYAWFTMMETSDPIIFNTGSISADVKFYQGVDHNDDQVIDEYQEVIDHLNFTNIVPGEEFYFRVDVKNKGTIDGHLDFKINEIIFEDEEILDDFIITFINPITENYQEFLLLNYQQLIFDNYVLEKDANFFFDFKLKVSPELDIQNVNLQIKSFTIKLEQIH